ncbi:MAG: glutathione S-transferase N-terminal domain-containing protein, partial [Alphaproteobacteria bacterium]|nr:glutathione S-transferase N-terminal domain-containing protein [Alphaproteobacteria bacterium]
MTGTDGEPGGRPYILYGVEASPYTVKLRAALRYRRLPCRWVCRFVQMYEPLAHVRPQLTPVLKFPNGELRTDSTPILEELEGRHEDGRSLLPERSRDRFLAWLIEDMADEWL